MRSLKLFRSNSARSAEPVQSDVDAGLLAFASEASEEQTGQSNPSQTRSQDAVPRLTLYLLAALVVLQSVPTFLWIKGRIRPAAPPPVVAAAPVAPAASIVPTPPCESTPAPTQPVHTPAHSPAAAQAATGAAAPPAPSASPSSSMLAGMIAIATPVPMQVYLKGKLVGTSEVDTIMLPVGSHDLEFRNDTVGYRARRSVAVQAGKTSNVKLDMPSGTLHVNAVPWADVSIDNQRVGETPIGNFQIPIGNHEVVFRHPDLGERRATVLVTAKEPARVSMDLRKK